MVTLLELEKFLEKLPLPATPKWPDGVWDIQAIKHGYMSASVFSPKKHDYQTPHEQDEIYFVTRGNGKMVAQNKTVEFKEGDAIFVQAGDEHRFEDFSEDLVLWVVFYGPKGGEP